jgi:large repetitive protein
MRTLISLSIIFCITAIVIFSCSKSTNPNPGPISIDSGSNSCIKLALTSPKGTDSQTVGLSVPITPISYKISKNQSSDTTGLAEVSVSAIGLPPGITTKFIGGVLTISGSAVKDSSSPYVYVIVASGNVCSVPLTGVITVKECATIHISTPSQPYVQNVPSNTAIAPISYTVGGGGTGATATGLPSGITGSFSGGIFTISGTLKDAPDSLYHYFVTTSGGYCNAMDSGYITVTSCPVITLTSAQGTNRQTISTIGQAIQPITYEVTGHYTNIVNPVLSGFPPGVNGVVTGNKITITGIPQQQAVNGQVFSYDFVITVNTDVNSGCSPVTALGNITIEGE